MSLTVSLILFLAVFIQSSVGFGVALIAMALLPTIIGIQLAVPLVAVVAITLEVFMLIRYRHALEVRAVLPIALSSLVGIPLGLLLFENLPERVALGGLGVLISGYALYALLNMRLPGLSHPGWAYLTGLVAGMFGGAYNISGPPVIIYGNCRRWEPEVFKSNLQGFFVVNSLMVVVGHAMSGNITPQVWQTFLYSLPGMILGFILGISLDRWLKPAFFRKLVLSLLFLMGLRLLLF